MTGAAPHSESTEHVAVADARFYESLCRNLGFGLFAGDRSLRIVFWNKQAEVMFVGRPDAIAGAPLDSIFPESVRSSARQLIEAALAEGVAGDLEFSRDDVEGKPALLTSVVSPVVGPDGTLQGVSVSMRDITRRRELTRQLSRSRRMASLGAMAGGVAHHFNSILGGVATRLDFLLSMMHARDKHRRDLEQVAEAIGRAARISGQLMTFAEGDHEAGFPQDLVEVVTRFVSDNRPATEQLGVRMTLEAKPIKPTVVESRRLMAVLDAMRHNAIEAMPNGGELRLSIAEDGDYALLTVSDTGAGIPREKLERVFEPFFTTKGELGGGAGRNTGLSLSVVHSFIADMGGRIEVSSLPGAGTRFDVRLPLGARDISKRRASF